MIDRKVTLEPVIFKRIKFDNKTFWTFSFDFFVQNGEFVQLDVPTRRGVSHETEANHANVYILSTASEARSINLERQRHRSGRSPRPDGP